MKTCRFLLLNALLTISASACAQENPFLAKADVLYDLENGNTLTVIQASKSDGVYGEIQTELFNSPQAISFVRFKPGRYSITVVSAEEEMADSTSALCLKNQAIAGINGSYFNMRNLTNVTYVKDDGIVTGTTTKGELFRTNGAIVFDSDLFSIYPVDSSWVYDGWEAMASGPVLIDEGVSLVYGEDRDGWKSFYSRRHPRSMVGYDADGYIWLVVVDGRVKESAAGMTIAEMTALSEMMGLTDALNLDGGGSSTLWTLEGGVLNHPCDNHKFDNAGQRRVPNILAVKRER